jgi:hypothetical protein
VGWGWTGKEERLVNGTKLQLAGVNPGVLLHSMATVVKSGVLYISK